MSKKTEKKDIPTEEEIKNFILWLTSKEGETKIIEIQKENSEVKRLIKEMNNYDPSLILRPYTI